MKNKKITTIIFDLDGVLFQENRTAMAKKIGIGQLAKYALFNWSNPESKCLDVLHTISLQESDQPKIPLIHHGRNMPRCIIDWQLGRTSHKQVQQKLMQQIEALDKTKFFKSAHEKELTQRILDISLDPEHLIDVAKPITSMVQLAKQLKQQGFRLFILSNLAKEPFNVLRSAYADIAQLFDGIIISGHVQMLKPHKEIYEHLLNTYKLNRYECVLIDNLEENIKAANKMGIAGIVHKNTRSTKAQLIKLGVKIF